MTVPTTLRETVPPLDAAEHFLQRLKEPSRICVAVSGGSDSLGALLALHTAMSVHQCHSLHAVTIDHGLRPEAAQEAQTVGTICHALGITHQTCRWIGEKPQSGIPAKAREERYRLLNEAATAVSSAILVTGHTLDDQAETFAMRQARNDQSNRGLAGMAEATLYHRRMWIIRPFLSTSRQALRDLLRRQNLAWVEDPSNQDERYERAKRRKAGVTVNTIERERQANTRTALSLEAARWIERYCSLMAGSIVRINAAALQEEAETVVTAISVLLAVIGGRAHLPPKSRVEEMVSDLASDRRRRLTLSRTLVVAQSGAIWLAREKRGLLTLPIAPGEQKVWDGRFSITNVTTVAGHIEPGPIAACEDVLPASLGPSTRANWPKFVPDTTIKQSLKSVRIKPSFPLFDNFLPSFDLAVADAINALFHREPLPALPV